MRPKIVKMDKRCIMGMFGDIKNQGGLREKVAECYGRKPFKKSDKYDCHVYLWDMPEERQFFFGYETEHPVDGDYFAVIEIPACEWAVFEVRPAKWWVSGDEEVEGWIASNGKYKWRKYGGSKCQLEYYKEKFLGEKNPDSLMEVWYPLEERQG